MDGAVFYAVRSVQLTSATTDYGTPLDDEKTVLGWIAEYYNGDGVFLEERLHLLAVTFSESDFGWVAFHDEADGLYQCVGCVGQTQGELEYTLSGGGWSAGMTNSDDDGIYKQVWSGQDGWNEANPDIAIPDGSLVIDSLVVKQETASFTVYKDYDYLFDEMNTVTGTFYATTRSTGEDRETYVLYEDGGDIFLNTYIDYALDSTETVFSGLTDPQQGVMHWNDYVAGQLSIAIKSTAGNKKQLHFALKRANGWVKDTNIFNKSGSLRIPNIQAFENGKINMFWKHKKKLYVSTYKPGASQWTQPLKRKNRYAGRRWYKAYSSGVTYSSNAKKTLEWFRSPSKKYFLLRKWNVAKNLSGAPIVRMKKNFTPIEYSRHGDYYIFLLNKGNKLRAIVKTDTDLF